jgi:large repetitive protein
MNQTFTMKHTLLTVFVAACLFFGLSITKTYGCDFSPSVNATNVVDNGDGTYSFTVLMCIGESGSQNGPSISLSNGINIVATTSIDLVNPYNGNVANGTITAGNLNYSFPGFPGEWWKAEDGEFGPCFTFELTVDADPSAATVSFTNINDACLNDISGGVWSTVIVSTGLCNPDYSVTAPATISGNTFGAGNDCDFRPSEDITIEVEVVCEGIYTFTLCDGALWDTYLFLSASCCEALIFENDDWCGAQSEITTFLPQGIYYLTIEGFFAVNSGEFSIDISTGEQAYKADAGEDQDICETFTTLEGNVALVGEGTWSVISGSGVFADPNDPNTAVTGLSNGPNVFAWTIDNAPCDPSVDFVTIVAGGDITINCPASIMVNNDAGQCSAVVNYATPTGSSECGDITIVQTAGLASGSTFPVGVSLVTWEITDTFGNIETCTFSVTVVDAEVPQISCVADIVVNVAAGECSAVVTFNEPVGTDNCPGASTSLISGLGSGATFPVGNNANVYEVLDASGNANFCVVNVLVVDNEFPVFDCPEPINIAVDAGDCDAVVTYDLPTASDNCPGLSAVTLQSGLGSGATFPVGVNNEVYIVTDASGNVSTCTITITVTEPVLPEITCPGDITFDISDGICGHIVNYLTPVGTDNCPGAVTELTEGLASGSLFPAGVTIVEYTVTDASGNTASCSFTVTITDTIAPSITCPIDIVVNNDPNQCGAIVTYSAPVANDNCPDFEVTLIEGLASGSFFPVGTTIVIYQIEDVSGNIDVCTFDVTVNDTQPPTPVCNDVAVNTDPGECSAVVNYTLPTATDNCPGGVTVSFLSGLGTGATFPVGTTTETYLFQDAAGNLQTCEFDVIVTDNEAPVLECPMDVTFMLAAGSCDTTYTFIAPIGTDNCPGVNTVQTEGIASGEVFPVGVHVIEFTSVDANGNATTCEFTVTILEPVPPTITCPESISVSSDPTECGAIVNYVTPVGEDNCPGVNTALTNGLASGSLFPVGITLVEYTATDASGNQVTCSFAVEVIDDVVPIITCPSDIVTGPTTPDCQALVNYPAPGAVDNCGLASVELVSGLASGSLFPTGTTTIVYVATDVNGNTATCSFTVTVEGENEPSILCPANVVVPNTPDSCGAFVTYNVPVGIDGCGGEFEAQLIFGIGSGGYFPIGTTEEIYQIVTSEGTASCSFNVTVLDEQNPVITCPENITIVAEGGECELPVDFDAATATDNCPGVTVEQTGGLTSGSDFGIGVNTVTFTATDASGNTTTCSFTITIVDPIDPTISNCPADITVNATQGVCGAVVTYESPIGDDNCDFTLELTAGLASGATFPVGTTTVTYTVTDLSGNTASCSFNVTVVDNIAPTITCPGDISTCEPVVTFSPTANDNCPGVTVTQTAGPASGTVFPVGTTTVTFVATDASGNTATCSFSVTVSQSPGTANAGQDRLICKENSVQLSGNQPNVGVGTWTIISGSGTISDVNDPNATVSNLEDGVLIIEWSFPAIGDCPGSSDTVVITVQSNVTVDAGPDISYNGTSAQLNAVGSPEGGTYNWTPAGSLSCTECPNPIATPTVTTTYTVTYTSELGCTDTDQVTVTVFTTVPTGFTPNGDGTNDVWNIPNADQYPDMEVFIYNRWGNLIFESIGYRVPWDGTNKGKDLPAASYYFVIDYKDGSEAINGTVTIIR